MRRDAFFTVRVTSIRTGRLNNKQTEKPPRVHSQDDDRSESTGSRPRDRRRRHPVPYARAVRGHENEPRHCRYT